MPPQSRNIVPNVPDGWKGVFDEEYQTWFFVDLKTRNSQWEAPAGTTWPGINNQERSKEHDPPPLYEQVVSQTPGGQQPAPAGPLGIGYVPQQQTFGAQQPIAGGQPVYGAQPSYGQQPMYPQQQQQPMYMQQQQQPIYMQQQQQTGRKSGMGSTAAGAMIGAGTGLVAGSLLTSAMMPSYSDSSYIDGYEQGYHDRGGDVGGGDVGGGDVGGGGFGGGGFGGGDAGGVDFGGDFGGF